MNGASLQSEEIKLLFTTFLFGIRQGAYLSWPIKYYLSKKCWHHKILLKKPTGLMGFLCTKEKLFYDAKATLMLMPKESIFLAMIVTLQNQRQISSLQITLRSGFQRDGATYLYYLISAQGPSPRNRCLR